VIQRQYNIGNAQHVLRVRLEQRGGAWVRAMGNCTEVVLLDLWGEALARYHSRLVSPELNCILVRDVTANRESMIPMSQLFCTSARRHEVH